MTDLVKARRENMRWLLLNALNNARPLGAMDVLLLTVVHAIHPDATARELHTELEYLESKDLIDIERQPTGHWHSKLNALGIDVVEYTVNCPAGIARPTKYWG
ncbi:hypothetical protein B9T25_06335 [Acinetobacter sp. ANC 4470]|uniref:hypothetical protein n=1 Tax=Acinetobacter sp. ANC 4470 TaxID=1977881 RepID=UPI000A352A72|nr:hypothetical protein [Acinetobacter sp. ANC 4470]OTG68296.1 hypothetical protein B9T25_06335 [Acinetobacter sp. ANC 4470]